MVKRPANAVADERRQWAAVHKPRVPGGDRGADGIVAAAHVDIEGQLAVLAAKLVICNTKFLGFKTPCLGVNTKFLGFRPNAQFIMFTPDDGADDGRIHAF